MSQTRSPWEMNLGGGLVSFGFTSPQHGAVVEYNFASIPPTADPGWGPAPDGNIINYSQIPSTLCNRLACRTGGDFTYFQTFVDVPANVVVTTFTIAFQGVDDGVRVTIFNSDYPGGVVVPGSYVFLGGTGTANLAGLVKSGETNRVVITQVDDCCFHSFLRSAAVVLNGRVVPTNDPPVAICQDTVLPLDQDGQASLDPAQVDDGSYDPDGDPIDLSLDRTEFSCSDLGMSSDVTLTVTDDGDGSDSCIAEVSVVDPIPPTLTCSGGGTYECASKCGFRVDLDASASDNCTDDPVITDDRPACFPLGDTEVTFTATDESGNSATCDQTVSVVDTRGPRVRVGSPINEIWPPNHKCKTYDLIDACDIRVRDRCFPARYLSVDITGITSDEPFEVNQGGDGHHSDDIEILDATTFKLRSERQGGSNGRFYTVHFEVTDPAGNATRSRCQFVVPHDQSPQHTPVNDGPVESCEPDGDCACLSQPAASERGRAGKP